MNYSKKIQHTHTHTHQHTTSSSHKFGSCQDNMAHYIYCPEIKWVAILSAINVHVSFMKIHWFHHLVGMNTHKCVQQLHFKCGIETHSIAKTPTTTKTEREERHKRIDKLTLVCHHIKKSSCLHLFHILFALTFSPFFCSVCLCVGCVRLLCYLSLFFDLTSFLAVNIKNRRAEIHQ